MLNGQNWEFDQVMMEGVKETQSQKIKDILVPILGCYVNSNNDEHLLGYTFIFTTQTTSTW